MTAGLLLLASLLAFQSSAGGCSADQGTAAPTADPLAGMSSIPAGEVSLAGKTVARVADGDFVHPAFSSDSRKLAYSGVVVQEGTELTEIWVQDLATGNRIRLLDAEASRKYAVYKSFVFGLEWKDSMTLQAQISDGDVDSTIVDFEVPSGKILSEEFGEGDLDFPTNSPLFQEARAAFPSWPEEVLDNALRQGFRVGEGRFIAQKDYAGEDDHVWFLDIERKQATRLLELPEGWHRALGGAFVHGETTLFLLKKLQEATAHVVAYRDGSVTRLAEIATEWDAWLKVKHTSEGRVVFLVQVHRTYDEGNNPLFVFDGAGLKRVTDVEELYDVAIDTGGKLICYVAWEGEERHLIVNELQQ